MPPTTDSETNDSEPIFSESFEFELDEEVGKEHKRVVSIETSSNTQAIIIKTTDRNYVPQPDDSDELLNQIFGASDALSRLVINKMREFNTDLTKIEYTITDPEEGEGPQTFKSNIGSFQMLHIFTKNDEGNFKYIGEISDFKPVEDTDLYKKELLIQAHRVAFLSFQAVIDVMLIGDEGDFEG